MNYTKSALNAAGYKVQFHSYRPSFNDDKEHKINKNKYHGTFRPRGGRVVCEISLKGKVVATGVAKCNISDIWRPELGKPIAFERALVNLATKKVVKANLTPKKRKKIRIGSMVHFKVLTNDKGRKIYTDDVFKVTSICGGACVLTNIRGTKLMNYKSIKDLKLAK